jgi:hypothetical protein
MPILQHSIEILWILAYLAMGFVSGCIFVVYQAGKRKGYWYHPRIARSRQ